MEGKAAWLTPSAPESAEHGARRAVRKMPWIPRGGRNAVVKL